MTQGERADFEEFFCDLAGKAGDLPIVKPLRDAAGFGALHPLHLFFLLLKIAFVFEIRLHAAGFFPRE